MLPAGSARLFWLRHGVADVGGLQKAPFHGRVVGVVRVGCRKHRFTGVWLARCGWDAESNDSLACGWHGAGGMPGHAVNPSVEARGRHPWRPTVPASHPHRAQTVGRGRIESKSRPPVFFGGGGEKSSRAWPGSTPGSAHDERVEPGHARLLLIPSLAAKCFRFRFRSRFRPAPQQRGQAMSQALAWVGWRDRHAPWMAHASLHGCTCGVSRHPTHAGDNSELSPAVAVAIAVAVAAALKRTAAPTYPLSCSAICMSR